MNYRTIGNTTVKISEIGLGCWALGGLNWEKETISSGVAPINNLEIGDSINFAVDNGITHFDTADVYGNGKSEQLLAKSLGKKSSRVTIASKVGYLSIDGQKPYSPKNIIYQCEKSLKNLNSETIDIYYYHHCRFGKNQNYLDEAIDMMERLKKSGKIRAIGLSGFSVKEFKKYIPIIKPDIVQAPANMMDYHLISKGGHLRELCEKYQCSLVAFQPLNAGILLGKYSGDNLPAFEDGDYRKDSPKFRAEYLKNAEVGLNVLGEKFGLSTKDRVSLALRFLLKQGGVTGVIPGFRNKKQVEDILKANDDKPLNGEDLKLIYRAFS
jgi:myo-inositol catabolism protein IolS